MDNSFYTSVIGAALISMMMLPILTRYSDRIWDRAVDRCPRKAYAACCGINEARSRMYERVSVTSRKSQKAVYRSMTHTYINILAIAAIEIIFFVVNPGFVDWLVESFGGNSDLWVLGSMGLNLVILMIPTYYLINNVKFLDEIIISGAKRIANMEGGKDNPTAKYDRFLKFLEINTYLLMIGIDILIILFVPSSVATPLWYYLIILGAAVLFIVMMYLNKRHKAKKEGASDEDAPADQESKEE